MTVFPRPPQSHLTRVAPHAVVRGARLARYATGAAVWLAALALTITLAPYIQRTQFVWFWIAIIFSAWYVGVVPAVLMSVASVVVVNYYLYGAPHTTGLIAPRDVVETLILVAASVTVSVATSAVSRAQRRATWHAAEAEALAERIERLNAATAALTGALTPPDVADVIMHEGLDAIGASGGALCLFTPDRCSLRIVSSEALPAATEAEFHEFPIDAPLPVTEAIRTGAPIYLPDRDTVVTRYPALREANGRTDAASWVAVPLVTSGEPLGGLTLSFREAREFGDDDRAFVDAIARQCALALERARLYAAERAAREEADRRRAEAEAANRTKSEFLAVMSHELRTPLNAIGGYVDLLDLGVRGPMTEPQREDLARIRRSQHHLLSLINDVLNFARIDAGRVEYHVTDVPLDETLAALGELVAPQVAEKGITYEYRPCESSLVVRADVEKLRQVVLNLLSNAIKFTPAGGRVTLECTAAGDGRAAVIVRDTGIGIPPDQHAAIFEPFVQVRSGLTRQVGGTGLGLAISRDLARAMGGELMVTSEVGAGAAFTLVLALA